MLTYMRVPSTIRPVLEESTLGWCSGKPELLAKELAYAEIGDHI